MFQSESNQLIYFVMTTEKDKNKRKCVKSGNTIKLTSQLGVAYG